jgi:predicted  nucleic acid-binding Zn-ribbon protein
MFKCLECGRKFKTARAAERAFYHGCPGCGASDIDLDTDPPRKPRRTDPRGLRLHRPPAQPPDNPPPAA